MKLNSEFYDRLQKFTWFANCGSMFSAELEFSVIWLPDKNIALASLVSDLWMDVRTEAQGDLTGYLAKHHYNSYGGYWNNLARESRRKLDQELMPIIREKLQYHDLGGSIAATVLLDVNRAALEMTYREHFPKVPAFFSQLLMIYEYGHLPCGWNGQMINWPSGTLVAY
ncbi:MAG: hypothetical protein LBE81_05950 [Azonexus sp.]|jgi:hypothetical protein|uniref:hypothetical protein n=1 Tax=Azonexus sp. TaxID=1872668 RepID=UPI002836B70F|nr:hypothetical protein [Azonexus sp.]MDR0776165.1 hypothetical protein [Azonexus sp.]